MRVRNVTFQPSFSEVETDAEIWKKNLRVLFGSIKSGFKGDQKLHVWKEASAAGVDNPSTGDAEIFRLISANPVLDV